MRDKGGDTPPLLLGRNIRLSLDRPLIMGILNLTPDSFYDGGRYIGLDSVLRRVSQMVDEGAEVQEIFCTAHSHLGAPELLFIAMLLDFFKKY